MFYRLAAMFLLLSVSACASYEQKTVLLKAPDAYPTSVTQDDIVVGLEVYDTDAKTQAAFDEKLVRKGIYPIQLVLKNNSEDTILVVRDFIRLDSNVSQMLTPMGAQEVAEEFENNAIAHAVFGFGIFSYGAAKDANDEREADFASKQMPQELLVRPGRLGGGFMFFRSEAGETLSGRRVIVPVERVGKNEQKTVELLIP